MTTAMYVAVYNKVYQGGLLKGLSVDVAVSYPTKKGADGHIKAVKDGVQKEALTGSEWIATNCKVVPLAKLGLSFRSRHGLI